VQAPFHSAARFRRYGVEKMIAPSKINFEEKFAKLPNKDYSVRIITLQRC
jgi:hypothetical protein